MQNSTTAWFYLTELVGGSGCCTAVEHTPVKQNSWGCWVWIPLGAGLFSSLLYPISSASLIQVPQKGANYWFSHILQSGSSGEMFPLSSYSCCRGQTDPHKDYTVLIVAPVVEWVRGHCGFVHTVFTKLSGLQIALFEYLIYFFKSSFYVYLRLICLGQHT